MSTSDAIALDRISRVVGYKLKAENFGTTSGNLPQRIGILGEANTANQTGLTTEPFEFSSAKQVGDKYGYGSPLYMMARILRPQSGNILGGVVTEIYPQIEAGGATASIFKLGVAIATSVTKNATHYLKVNGRDNIDGQKFAFNVAVGENVATVEASIVDCVSNVLGSPVSAVINATNVDFTAKWKGATGILDVEVVVADGEDAGIVYSTVSNTDGTGAVDVATSLALFGSKWNTIVINPYGVSAFSDLETFNGIPDPDVPTGRYGSTVFKPFVALAGSKLSTVAGLEAITDISARKDQVTNAICPAPNSKAFDFEAAANMAVTYALLFSNSPHLGNGGRSYLDMPVPTDGDIGDFEDYNNRDSLAKKGCSTVNLTNGKYTVQDFETTYHPDGEIPAKFRKVRDLNLDWNIEFGWRIIMLRDVQDKAIVADDAVVRVNDIISPKQGKQLLFSYLSELQQMALIADLGFSEDSVLVEINATNPARLDFFFRYKRTSTSDIASTNAEFDFFYSVS